MQLKHFVFLLCLTLPCAGCFIVGDGCETYLPQKWNLGKLEAELNTGKPVLDIGDSLIFKFSLAQHLTDTNGIEMNIDKGVMVFLKITTTTNPNDTLHNDFFTTDTTIFKVFDRYFEMRLIHGDTLNAYHHQCELIGDHWEIETNYIAKRPGSYWARIELLKINASDDDVEEGVCMEGDTETFGASLIWKKSELNRIDYLFNDELENFPTYFGFIVQ